MSRRVRSSVSRLSRRGMLGRSRRQDQVGYELSAQAEKIIEEGDLRIFTSMQPADLRDVGWSRCSRCRKGSATSATSSGPS